MATKQSTALLDLLAICRPDDQDIEHEHQVASITTSPLYQELARRDEFKEGFERDFSVDQLRKCSEKQLDAIPERLKRERKVQDILLSEDYQVLAHREAFHRWFDDLYGEKKIRKCSEKQLEDIATLLPQVSLCLDNIVFSLRSGAGPELTPKDAPNFSSGDSISRLNRKLDKGSGKNYTNIDADDFMAVFDQETVKSVGAHFQELPVDCKDYAVALSAIFAPQKFCVSDRELQELESEYSARIKKLQETLDEGKGKHGRRRIIKAFIGIALLFVPSLVAGATGLLSAGAVSLCTLAELVLVIIFWLRG